MLAYKPASECMVTFAKKKSGQLQYVTLQHLQPNSVCTYLHLHVKASYTLKFMTDYAEILTHTNTEVRTVVSLIILILQLCDE